MEEEIAHLCSTSIYGPTDIAPTLESSSELKTRATHIRQQFPIPWLDTQIIYEVKEFGIKIINLVIQVKAIL